MECSWAPTRLQNRVLACDLFDCAKRLKGKGPAL
jgi:hypothetical protein